MRQHCKYNSDKLMSHSKYGLFVGDSFRPPAQEIFSEGMVVPCYLCGHEPENTPEVPVAPLGDSALPLEFPGLMDGGIKPGVSDKLFVVLKTAHIPNLGQEVEGSDISNALDGFEDPEVLKSRLMAHLGQHIGELLQFFLKQKKLRGLLREDEFSSGTHGGDGAPRQRDKLLGGYPELPSPGFRFDKPGYLRGGEGFDHPGRGVMSKEIEDGSGVDIGCSEELREGDREKLLDVVFEPGDLRGEPFSFSGQLSKIRREEAGLWQGAIEHGQETGDGEGILPIGFSFPEGKLHEVRDKQRVNNNHLIALFGEEGREVNVITAGGFQTDEDRVLGKFGEVLGKLLESFHIHRGGELKELIFFLPYGTGSERAFGDIQSDEYLIHKRTSCKDFLARAGAASRPILHDDEGFLAQPTYHGCGRQGTDSFEGFLAQEKWSSPALPFLLLMGKTHSYKSYTTNS